MNAEDSKRYAQLVLRAEAAEAEVERLHACDDEILKSIAGMAAERDDARATAERERKRADTLETRLLDLEAQIGHTTSPAEARIEALEGCVRLARGRMRHILETASAGMTHAEVGMTQDVIVQLDALLASAPDAEPPVKNTTRYIQDEWGDYWTCEECKVDLCYENDGPEENGVKFCSACGRRIVEFVLPKPEDDEDEEPSAESSGEHGAENPEAGGEGT